MPEAKQLSWKNREAVLGVLSLYSRQGSTMKGFFAIKINLYDCDTLRDLLPFVQFKKHEKHPWRSVTFSKVVGLPATLLKLTLLHECFSCFLNCTNDTKSSKTSYVIISLWFIYDHLFNLQPQACNFIKNETSTQVFFYEFCKIFIYGTSLECWLRLYFVDAHYLLYNYCQDFVSIIFKIQLVSAE